MESKNVKDSLLQGNTIHNANSNANDTNNTNTKNTKRNEEDYTSPQWAHSLSNLSTPLLDSKLTTLKSQSSHLASTLTAKLASSPSGQSLLHIGPSLSTLPPDLQSLLSSLEPMLESITEYETWNQNELMRIVTAGKLVEAECRRAVNANECNDLWNDLVAAEGIIQNGFDYAKTNVKELQDSSIDIDNTTNNSMMAYYTQDELNYMVSLERVAHTTLHLVHELQKSSEQVTSTLASTITNNDSTTAASSASVSASSASRLPSMDTPLPQDTEKAQFMMKLAPRIRNLEKNIIQVITKELERILNQRTQYANNNNNNSTNTTNTTNNNMKNTEQELLILSSLFRSFALLNRGSDAELLFARVAIMPIVRRKITLGKLDEGGSRGECAGLFCLLQDLICCIKERWGDVLRLVEGMFQVDDMSLIKEDNDVGDDDVEEGMVEIDLVTAGVWVPIATSLMTDPTIKMAIFSPGITSILQANYVALDTFLSEFATNLLADNVLQTSTLQQEQNTMNEESKFNQSYNDIVDQEEIALKELYHKPQMNLDMIHIVQSRLYKHSMTTDFTKKWNLPIYYQLRFGEACKRLEKAIECVQINGWYSKDVFTKSDDIAQSLRESFGFEIPFFLEVYDIMSWLWQDDVFLKPLTHRFLRGAIQLLGRVVLFVQDGLKGEIKFGVPPVVEMEEKDDSGEGGEKMTMKKAQMVDNSYFWNERIDDVAAVSWDLTILESCISDAYVTKIANKIVPMNDDSAQGCEHEEVKQLVVGALVESSEGISPIIEKIWNEIIVNILTAKCSTPLAAVKGVAATYRMTNRPPPSQASPFVATILSPLKEFNGNFMNRTPPQVGFEWKRMVVSSVAEKYCVAVSELTETVQRTEEALKNRKARRAAAGGMSDGEKVKLQLLLDQKDFYKYVEEVGVDAQSVEHVTKLVELTESAESLLSKS